MLPVTLKIGDRVSEGMDGKRASSFVTRRRDAWTHRSWRWGGAKLVDFGATKISKRHSETFLLYIFRCLRLGGNAKSVIFDRSRGKGAAAATAVA